MGRPDDLCTPGTAIGHLYQWQRTGYNSMLPFKAELFSRWILFNSNSKRLTLLIILINRLNEELKQNIKDKISIIGISKNINDENIEENIADKFMKDIFFKLKEIKKDLKILDNGVTRILSIANTKKSYG